MSRLTKTQQKELYQTVRFVHMPHEALIALSNDAKYDVAKG